MSFAEKSDMLNQEYCQKERLQVGTERETSGYSRTERHTKQPKKKKKVRKKAILLIVCVLLILIAGGLAMAGMSIKPPSLDKLPVGEDEQQEEREDGIYNVLVVGTDKVGLNTDTILVMSLDSVNNRANVMSIPRDTMSNVSRSVKKINAAYSIGAKKGKGNIDNLKKEVSYLLGFEVDNYVVVNLSAFEEIIDAIGGVTIDVPRNMNYDDPYQDLHIHINKGVQTLNGQQAIGFVRYRSGYAEGDLGRVKAQQLFIEAVAKQLASPSTVTKLPKLADIVLRNMDTDLTNGEILWFAKEAMELDMSTSLNMFVLPGAPQYVSGLSYYLPNEAEILEIVNTYFNPYATPISSLNVVNVNTIVQKEKARQSSLTPEQKKKEEERKKQVENEASISENELLTGDEPNQTGTDPAADPNSNPELTGQEPNSTTEPNGQEPAPSTGNEPSDVNSANPQPNENQSQPVIEPQQPVDNGSTNTEQPTVEPTQPGGIPGEVLKTETEAQPVSNDPSAVPDGV